MNLLHSLGPRVLSSCLAVTAICSTRASAQEPDLPFDSGSTGADGDLVFLPTAEAAPRRRAAAAFSPEFDAVVFLGGETTDLGNGTREFFSWNGVEIDTSLSNWVYSTWGSRMIYDSARMELVRYGGFDTGYSYWRDPFTHDFDSDEWTPITRTNGIGPNGGTYFIMAYDPLRQETVIYGGYNRQSTSSTLSDTYVWDGTDWTQKTPTNTPTIRAWSAGAFDEINGELIIFGGRDENNQVVQETWSWNGEDWAKKSPSTSPPARRGHEMTYDAARGEILMFGGYSDENQEFLNDTWVWKDGDWTQKLPTRVPSSRYLHAMADDPTRDRVVLFGGDGGTLHNDLWEWDGSDWIPVLDSVNQTFDMTDRPDGIYHYNRVEIPSGMTLTFKKNANNSPVTWLAQEDVIIDGTVNLNGENGNGSPDPVNAAQGGPGGFAGGLGGFDFNTSGSYAGTPGLGPGGGAPGTTQSATGQGGQYLDAYGNAYIQPLIGGSGGGGKGSTASSPGGNGGGGGGAILIASSRDIIVNGSIQANGGNGASNAGGGSGGAIRLACDVFRGSGTLRANGGYNGYGPGRIRVEAFTRPFYSSGGSAGPTASISAPLDSFSVPTGDRPELMITNVSGMGVAQPPGGDLSNPDVIFEESGPVNITVAATNIPDGTPVTCRISSSGQTINLPLEGDPEVPLSGGAASFSTVVPAGRGSIQAFATFTR